MTGRGPLARAVLVVAAVQVALLLAFSGRYGYHRDELYFIVSGQHPAWGYPDQPSLIPLLSAGMHVLAPHSLLLLRLPSALAVAATTVVAALTAREVGGDRRAQLVAAGCMASSGFALSVGHFVSTTTYDLLSTGLFCWLVVRALVRHSGPCLLAAGIVAGAGFEAKPQVALVAVVALLAVAVLGPRWPLRSPWLLAAVGAAVVLALPYVLWQAGHGWPQLTVAANVGGTAEGGRIGFVPFQLLLVSPVLAPVWIAGLVAPVRRASLRALRFLPVTYAVLAVAYLAGNGKAYYLASLYPALLGIGALPVADWTRRARYRAPLLQAGVVVSVLVALVIALPLLPADKLQGSITMAINPDQGEMVGWPAFLDQVDTAWQRIPAAQRAHTVIVTGNYGEAGAIDLLDRGNRLPRSYSGQNGFAGWGRPPATATQVLSSAMTTPGRTSLAAPPWAASTTASGWTTRSRAAGCCCAARPGPGRSCGRGWRTWTDPYGGVGTLRAMESWTSPDVPEVPGDGVPLRLHDTATCEVRPTAPGPTAGMYVCGITPYDATHIGHAATYLAFDLVNRVWRDNGHLVRYVQNVTDVDDPLLERAARDGEDWRDLALRETQLFREDMTALRVLAPDDYVGAVQAIPEIIPLVEQLLATGAAYELDGDIYQSVASDPRFGSVSNENRATMLAQSAERGGDPDRPGKKDPLDPQVWRAERPGEPSWEAPFGRGRPGWHVECAAIALNRLGMGFDVQGGGNDLPFPHHECSATHAQTVTGEWPFARSYVHAGMLSLDGEKMSKSRGNLVFVSRLRLAGTDPAAIRLALFAGHYRADRPWTGAQLIEAEQRLARWREAVRLPTGPAAADAVAHLRARLADDLDTPAALAGLDRWASQALTRTGTDAAAPTAMARAVDALLGISL